MFPPSQHGVIIHRPMRDWLAQLFPPHLKISIALLIPSLPLSIKTMTALIRWARQLVQRPPYTLRQLKSSHFHSISASQLIEEENLLCCEPEQFYPVRMGQVFDSEYLVLGKLGYGAYSTVWFRRDLSYIVQYSQSTWPTRYSHHRYVAANFYTQTHSQLSKANSEIETYEHLSKLNSLHSGQAYIREVYDTFKGDGPDGCNVCLVHPPLHITVSALQRQGLRQRYNEVLLRETLLRLFRALDFRHTVANVVHTGMLEISIRFTAFPHAMRI